MRSWAKMALLCGASRVEFKCGKRKLIVLAKEQVIFRQPVQRDKVYNCTWAACLVHIEDTYRYLWRLKLKTRFNLVPGWLDSKYPGLCAEGTGQITHFTKICRAVSIHSSGLPCKLIRDSLQNLISVLL